MEGETKQFHMFKSEIGPNVSFEDLEKEGYEVVGRPALIIGGQPGITNYLLQHAIEDSNEPLEYDAILIHWKTDKFRDRPKEDESAKYVRIFGGEIGDRDFLIAYALKSKTK